MKIKSLRIGELVSRLPIIQGGMGVGISSSSLASAVAREGGIGILSSIQIGFNEEDFETNPLVANLRALRKHIKIAKEKALGGIVGVNIMVASNNYEDYVKTALEEGVDLIISGAGLPTNLPKIAQGYNTKLCPIVSSAKATSVICKLWSRHHKVAPDMVVFEGPKAGGHLGYSKEQLKDIESFDYDEELKKIIAEVNKYEKEYNKEIPVIAAGGIFTGEDIGKYLSLGASGVQMGTRFVATEECDAHINYKMSYINSKKEDIDIVTSPVGMPGRAIRNKFINKISLDREPVTKCYKCITHCNPKETPYCISKALLNAVKGNVDDALLFCGDNAYRIDKIVTVKELLEELVNGILEYKPAF
ncbi:NAD(P)H-dependent flavin oxidoreductase YrpB, nitropropane dioxygenase family [Clostridium cavendishii DSM 21758]|uniref:Probable nitronate monooxygenase n=1 Tax=Clostridium cavendishii DSM 21758 TaxID=1121302 RepID=A0A1M6KSU8_9CLOT|nr:nitronate monooxygenase family protein [Clostridium cavendishii]SHJ61946.1 NAD(P)H-dependent flavin oxidoreductase YrpB, nitropropane dioxygenase family [Clostridium cavendishii DSM 21758]